MLRKDKGTVTYLGVDLGGTKLLVGEMTSDGRLLYTKKYPSGPLSQSEALEVICRSVEDFLENVRPENAPMPVGWRGSGGQNRLPPGHLAGDRF